MAVSQSEKRAGSLLIEASVVLAVVAVTGVIVAQCLVWSLRERNRLASRQAATEVAANFLEEARALPFDKLTAAWAEERTLPSSMAGLLVDGKVTVTAQPGPTPRTRRVHVEIRWGPEPIRESVELVTMVSARTLKKEGKP